MKTKPTVSKKSLLNKEVFTKFVESLQPSIEDRTKYTELLCKELEKNAPEVLAKLKRELNVRTVASIVNRVTYFPTITGQSAVYITDWGSVHTLTTYIKDDVPKYLITCVTKDFKPALLERYRYLSLRECQERFGSRVKYLKRKRRNI